MPKCWLVSVPRPRRLWQKTDGRRAQISLAGSGTAPHLLRSWRRRGASRGLRAIALERPARCRHIAVAHRSGDRIAEPPSPLEPIGTRALRAIITAVFLSALGANSVPAQSVSQAGIAFDDAKHRGWYVRFWTGSCKELRVICFSGAPYWSEIMQRLLANVPAERQEKLRTRLVLLGQR